MADTLVLIPFFTATGIANERFIAGMTWTQVLQAHLIGAVLMVPVGRPYGLWRERMLGHAGDTRLSHLLWDSLALMSFQMPIYAAILVFSVAFGTGLMRGGAECGGGDAGLGTSLWRIPERGQASVRPATRREQADVPWRATCALMT
jgi:hypothetical protein